MELQTQALRLAVWARRCGADERGTNIVEYVAVCGIALIVVGAIVLALIAGRFSVGQAMAGVLDNIIISFSAGRPGQANVNTSLYPEASPPQWSPEAFSIAPG